MHKVKSLFKDYETVLERQVTVPQIVDLYLSLYKFDVSKYFKDEASVGVYKCTKTGLRFFHPRHIGGDGEFYAFLQSNDWYYENEKWEYDVACEYIKGKKQVLEIGSGQGAFLRKLKNYNIEGTGLEINKSAVREAKAKGINVIDESIEIHAESFESHYDVVCSFQVMEHVADVHAVINHSIKILKPGGELIICVPNNESIINADVTNVLNMPPHHLNLWDKHSLLELDSVFPVRVLKIWQEPLQDKHFNLYYYLLMTHLTKKYGFMGKLINKCTQRNFKKWLKIASPFIAGHSIMIAYKKI